MVTTIVGIFAGAMIPILMFIATFRTLDSRYEKASEKLSWGKILIGLLIIWFIYKFLIEPPLLYHYTTLFLIKINLIIASIMFIINKFSFTICHHLNKKELSKTNKKKS